MCNLEIRDESSVVEMYSSNISGRIYQKAIVMAVMVVKIIQ